MEKAHSAGAKRRVALALAGASVASVVWLGATGSPVSATSAFTGCTPGYWKNHTSSWAATGYSPSQNVESVFDVPDALGLDTRTLLRALSFHGGSTLSGAAQILLRAGVAALLDSAHPHVDYPMTTSEVINAANAALASNSRSTILDLASGLDTNNNLGCTLN